MSNLKGTDEAHGLDHACLNNNVTNCRRTNLKKNCRHTNFLTCGTFKVHNGDNVRLWKDVWLGERPPSAVYPTLFRIVRRKDDTVAKVLGPVPLNVSFRRGLISAN